MKYYKIILTKLLIQLSRLASLLMKKVNFINSNKLKKQIWYGMI